VLYRGYPVEQLAEKEAPFMESDTLLLYGEFAGKPPGRSMRSQASIRHSHH